MTPRLDERGFLSELGFTPLTTVGVIARADSFGEGALGRVDPFTAAARSTDRIDEVLGGRVARVIPLSGLLAETALTGQLTEADAKNLAAWAGLSR